MRAKQQLAVPAVLGFVSIVGLFLPGCPNKDEPPPPLPEATADPAPSTSLQLEAEDAGVDADADAAKKAKGGPAPASGLKTCCAALAQNAKSAPPPNNVYMSQAAAVCYSMVAQGQGSGTIIGAIRGALKGAQMPSSCK
ncbi:MAG: acyltransferase [Polyangiaceae bacterium]|nr:acyltransferase [Myxococcales bacterium]MCB9583862.1 acyltransferase [Polyangiaceae bacterium]MCB9607882.1 acyltransferase [Polyangiaceae bacterium]